jgi:hypothetical protein
MSGRSFQIGVFGLFTAVTAATAIATSACGGPTMATYTPVDEKTKYPEESLFEASRKATENLGYIPHVLESPAHSLETREKQVAVSSVPRLSYKYSFHIETTNGQLSITAACTQNSATNEHDFKECGDERPERVVKELDALKKEILAVAPQVEGKQTDWGSLGKPDSAGDDKASADDDKDEGKGKAKGDAKKADKDDADKDEGKKTGKGDAKKSEKGDAKKADKDDAKKDKGDAKKADKSDAKKTAKSDAKDSASEK